MIESRATIAAQFVPEAPLSNPQSNPVSLRVDALSEQWTEFATDPEARLLVWQASQAELTLVEAFHARETDAQAAQTPDFFLRVHGSFVHPQAHGYALREELIAEYDAARPALEAEGVEAGWRPPHARQGDDDVRALVRTLSSFRAHHEREIELLALWLDPADVVDSEAYLAWLQRLVHAAEPGLRFFLVDLQDACAPLVRAEPARVKAQPCELDLPGALRELAQQSAHDSPGGKFRALFVELAAAAGAGEVEHAERLAQSAGGLAIAQGWLALAATVHMALAAAHLARQRHLDALRCYSEAERLAAQAEAAAQASAAAAAPAGGEAAAAPPSDPSALSSARQVRLQARLGQAATLIAHGAFGRAAEVYQAAHQLADALGDGRSQLDCLRMASVCLVRAGEPRKAWSAGLRALSVGAALDAETRKTSTFPYLCDHMLRMTEQPEFDPQRAPLEQQTAQLLGPDWRAALVAEG
jgi:tetratricopeptide (TPR) repeat protein